MKARVCGLIKMAPPALNWGLLFSSGLTVPTDGATGYQTSCLFQHTDGGASTALYVNEGSVTSSSFVAVEGADYGAFSSVTAGSGIAISSSNTSALAVYSDDAGVNVAASVRGLQSRFLLTVDASGSSIRALQGQLKLAAGVDVTTGIYTAVQGYVELAGATSVETAATFSCFDASLEIASATVLTVDSGGEACGLHVETTGAGTITNNGTCAAVLIDKASGAANWPYGVYVVGACVNQAFVAGAQDTGVDTTTTYPFAVEIHNEANADIVAGATGSSAGIYNRYAIEVAQTSQTNHISVFAKLRVKAALADGNHVAVYGLVEQSAGQITGTSDTVTAAGLFVLEISPTNITTGHLNGICIDSSVATGGTMGATMAAIRIKKSSAKLTWTTGIALEASAITTGITIGTCTTGISVTSATDVAFSSTLTTIVTGKYGVRVQDIFTLATAGVHKAISGECTYTPSTSGYATPIGVSGMAALGAANFTGGVGYMWGVQGVLSLGTSRTIDNAASVLAALRGVITGTTPTLNSIGIIAGLYCDNLCTTDLAGIAAYEVCFFAGWNSGGSMDTCAHFYGANDVATIFSFDGFAGPAPAISGGGSTVGGTIKKLAIKIDGVTYYFIAGTSIS